MLTDSELTSLPVQGCQTEFVERQELQQHHWEEEEYQYWDQQISDYLGTKQGVKFTRKTIKYICCNMPKSSRSWQSLYIIEYYLMQVPLTSVAPQARSQSD